MHIFFLLLLFCIPSVTHAMMHEEFTPEEDIPSENKSLAIDFAYDTLPKYQKSYDTSIKEIQFAQNNTYYARTERNHLLKGSIIDNKITFKYIKIKNVTHLGTILNTHLQDPGREETLSSYLPIVQKNFLNNTVSLLPEDQSIKGLRNLYTHNTDLFGIYTYDYHKNHSHNSYCITGSTYPSIVIYKDFLSKEQNNNKYKRQHNTPERQSFPGYFLIAAQGKYILYGSMMPQKDRDSKFWRWINSKFDRSNDEASIYRAKINSDLNASDSRTMLGQSNVKINFSNLRPGAISQNYALFFDSENKPYLYYGHSSKLFNIKNDSQMFNNMVGKPYIVNNKNDKYIIFITSDNNVYSILLPGRLEEDQLSINFIKNIGQEDTMKTVTHTYDKNTQSLYIVTVKEENKQQQQQLHILPLSDLLKN